MRSLNALLSEASKLPADQRLTLANRLLTSTEPSATQEIEQAWDLEIRRRIDRYDRQEGQARLAGDVLAELDRLLAR